MNLEDFYRVIRNGHVRAQGIVDTVPDPLLTLDSDLSVEAANRAFRENDVGCGFQLLHDLWEPLDPLFNALIAPLIGRAEGLKHARTNAAQQSAKGFGKCSVSCVMADEDQW